MKRTRFAAFVAVLVSGTSLVVMNLGACIGDEPAVTAQEAGTGTPDTGTPDTGTPPPAQDSGSGCTAPSKLCGAVCTNPQTDNANCGTCGHACGPGSACAGGTCIAGCPSGETLCGAACVNLQGDPANCSACGNACAPGLFCSAGQCAFQCGTGLTACPPAASSSAGAVDAGSVISCGTACLPTSCGAGDASAPPPIDAGAPLCVDPHLDDNNCGGCGVVCWAPQHCLAGSCVDPSSCINDGGTCAYATSCANLAATHSGLPDGNYTIDVDGTGPLHPFGVYCLGMASGNPKDYLALPHNFGGGFGSSNFTFVDDVGNGTGRCPSGGTIQCPNFTRWWTAVHLVFVHTDGGAPSIEIDPADLTFTSLSDPSTATAQCWASFPVGTCATFFDTPYGSANNCTFGAFSNFDLDLGGTPFTFDPSTVFLLNGFLTEGNLGMSADCTSVAGTVTGDCASITTCPADGGACLPLILDLH